MTPTIKEYWAYNEREGYWLYCGSSLTSALYKIEAGSWGDLTNLQMTNSYVSIQYFSIPDCQLTGHLNPSYSVRVL